MKGITMPIEKPRYLTDAYVGSFARDDAEDMDQLQMVKHMVSRFNAWLKQSGSNQRYRVCLKGRKPYKKMKTPTSKGPVSYTYWGTVVGGIENASVLKAYIYTRGS